MDNKLSELKAADLAATPCPWSFQIDGLNHEDVNITHWLAMPGELQEDA